METYQAEVLVNERFHLSEGPVWDAETGVLHFVDIKGCTVNTYRLSDGQRTSTEVNQNVGCFALRRQGGYILGLTAGIYLRSEDGRRIEKLPEPVYDPMTRSNDGKCDPQGRFWCGTSDLVKGEKRGKLYLLPGDGRCIEMLDRLEISNGLGFAGDTLYFIDSARHSVDSYRLDEDTLTLHDHRVIVPIEGNMVPDGMTMDEEGMLWVCHWGGGFVGRYDPRDGRLLARVEISASQCSSCCFGGPDMQTLFITCGAVNCPEESEAGKVFAVHLPYRGVESWKYRG